jgi:hypothetical protein
LKLVMSVMTPSRPGKSASWSPLFCIAHNSFLERVSERKIVMMEYERVNTFLINQDLHIERTQAGCVYRSG